MLVKSNCTDVYNNKSMYSYLDTAIASSIIDKPIITSPKNGDKVSKGTISITTSTFKCTGGTDTFKSVEVVISHDPYKEKIITTKVLDTTTISIDTTDIDLYTPIYVFVRHIGNNSGTSQWSTPVQIYLINTVQENNRKYVLYRHPSDKGTVVEYLWAGSTTEIRRMIVLDAVYRSNTNLRFALSNTNPTTPFYNLGVNTNGNHYLNGINGVNINTILPIDQFNNTNISNIWKTLAKDSTAKQNCDLWITAIGLTNLPMIKFCRDINLVHDGQKLECQLFNLYQAIIVFTNGHELDLMDPTAETYPTRKLGYTNPNGVCQYKLEPIASCPYNQTHYGFWYTSTSANYYHNNHYYTTMIHCQNGESQANVHYSTCGTAVIPIVEL